MGPHRDNQHQGGGRQHYKHQVSGNKYQWTGDNVLPKESMLQQRDSHDQGGWEINNIKEDNKWYFSSFFIRWWFKLLTTYVNSHISKFFDGLFFWIFWFMTKNWMPEFKSCPCTSLCRVMDKDRMRSDELMGVANIDIRRVSHAGTISQV